MRRMHPLHTDFTVLFFIYLFLFTYNISWGVISVVCCVCFIRIFCHFIVIPIFGLLISMELCTLSIMFPRTDKRSAFVECVHSFWCTHRSFWSDFFLTWSNFIIAKWFLWSFFDGGQCLRLLSDTIARRLAHSFIPWIIPIRSTVAAW